MALDIRKTGFQTYRTLQQQNAEPFNTETATAEDWYKQLRKQDYNAYSNEPTEYVGVQAAQAGYGESQYDEGLTSASQLQDLNDIRYENQPWYDTLANGVGKMLGTAGTTFLSSLIGVPYGLGTAAAEGRWSGLWDNDVTKAMSEVDDWMEKNMTNYQSQAQKEDPYFRFGDMNWWADNFIKNVGFTLGAAASMAVASGGLGLMSKSLGFVNDVSKGAKMVNNTLASLFSATGEGMIEARQGVEDRNKQEMQKLDDSLLPERQALEEEFNAINEEYAATRNQNYVMVDGTMVDPAYERYKNRMERLTEKRNALNEKYEAGKQQIEESGQRMGNKILLANQALLTAGNLIQFNKAMTKSYDSARHAIETSSKAVRPTGTWIKGIAAPGNTLKAAGKNFGRALILPKNVIKEGAEEMNQQWIQSSAGEAYNEADVNDYWRAKLDPDSYRETTKGLYTLGQILDRGFDKSWGDRNQWEQFLIGGLTGLMGSYTPTKLFNQDKTKSWWDPRRYGSWEGSALQDLQEFNRDYRQMEENIEDVNKILQSEDFPARIRSAVGHTYTESQKEEAAEAEDKKAFKDAEDKQMVHDIQAFMRIGRLDDLRAIYNEMGKEMDDEDIESIYKSTTKHITAEEDKKQHDDLMDMMMVNSLDDETRQRFQEEKDNYRGKERWEGPYVDADGNRTTTPDELRQTLKHNADELNRKLDSYLESIDFINKRTKGQLTKDQDDNLAYLHNLGKESTDRMYKIMSEVRSQLPKKFLLKTAKSPEEMAKEYASSDLSFTMPEADVSGTVGKEGYVEVDTSLMNDASFADFFQREVLRGGNIRPEFAETAEEKAAREEEEKNLPEEEQKKRAKERTSKKVMEGLEKQQADANEQWQENWNRIVDNFMANYKLEGINSMQEAVDAFSKVREDIQDAANLYDQAGVFWATLDDYMRNPEKIDRDKKKAEENIQKKEEKNQAKEKFSGKDAKQMNQEIAEGNLMPDDIDEFLNIDISDDEDLKAAQEEAKKSKEIREKGAALKDHIQQQVGDEIVDDKELAAMQDALQRVNEAMLDIDNPEDFSIDNPSFTQRSLDSIDINISDEELEEREQLVQDMIARGFEGMKADEDAREDIPDENPSVDDVEAPQTGDDPVVKADSIVVAPATDTKSVDAGGEAPTSLLTEDAADNIFDALKKLYEQSPDGRPWRVATGRHPYNSSTGTYHEDIAKRQYGEDSIEYKRSKAIWEYLDSVGAFDRLDNASEKDRIKNGDTIRFMARSIAQEVYEKDYGSLTEEERPYATVIYMVNDKNEVLGDLPLAEFEPSFKEGDPTEEAQALKALQDKMVAKFAKQYSEKGELEVMGDDETSVEEVMRGVIPFSKTEIRTLNEVAGDSQLELGIRVGNHMALKRGDKNAHKDIAIPSVGTPGQPYLLIPSASGEKMAIPFYTVAFNAERHQNTEFYRQLSNAIYYLIASTGMPEAQKKAYFQKHMDVLSGLLQVKREKGKSVISTEKGTITLHLQSLTDASRIYEFSVEDKGNLTDAALELAKAMSGISVNISLQFLNSSIETGFGPNARKSDYNRLVGEIADVNLPGQTQHPVNGWFTVNLVKTNKKGSNPSPTQPETQEQEVRTEETKPEEAATPESKVETIEDIEKEAKENGLLNRQTKEAWAVIPNDLKLKMFNEGARVQFQYGGKTVIADVSDLMGLTIALKNANTAAKAGSLQVSEAPKGMEMTQEARTREREKEARRWLEKNLPTLKREERTQFVDRIARMGDNASKYWGSYRSGVIEIQRNAPMGTVYHEAFHYVLDMVLSEDERAEVMKIASEEYGMNNNWAVEEKLAEDFRRYAIDENATGIVGKLKRWFRKLRDKIMRYNRISDPTINQLFWKINNGEMAQKAMEVESFDKIQQEVLREIRNVQREKYSWKNLSATTKRNMELTEEEYSSMSLEEQEHYVRCRG